MKHCLSIAIALLLAGCGGDSPPPAPPPAPPPTPPAPFSLSISPSAPWQMLYGRGSTIVWIGDGFTFPVCADPTTCSVGYVEFSMQANLGATGGIAMTWNIDGADPVFDYRTCNPAQGCSPNTCGPGTPGELSLMFRRSGADANSDRWFSKRRAPLVLGASSFSASLHDIAEWTGVYGANVAAFSSALANVSGVGFVFGGGCYSGHGVAVTSGSAKFKLLSYVIK